LDPVLMYLTAAEDGQQIDYPLYDIASRSVDNIYSDSDGDWYDNVLQNDPHNVFQNDPQAIALTQLMLDHVAGKYSLDDLETLEREAQQEDNSENQLRSLLQKVQRKSNLVSPYTASQSSVVNMAHPVGSHHADKTRPVVRNNLVGRENNLVGREHLPALSSFNKQRRGQKEEPVVVPANSIRRPIFIQGVDKMPFEDKKKKSTIATDDKDSKSTRTTTSESPKRQKQYNISSDALKTLSHDTGVPQESGVVEVVKVDGSSSANTSIREPSVQQAYEAFTKYLDSQRQHRMNVDKEILQRPEKRFVSNHHSDPLLNQLNSLKLTKAIV